LAPLLILLGALPVLGLALLAYLPPRLGLCPALLTALFALRLGLGSLSRLLGSSLGT
jgi:hypothetical protein